MIPAEITLRPMEPAELAAVVALDHLAFSDPWPRSAWQEMLDDPHALIWVAALPTPSPATEEEARPPIIAALAVWLILDEIHIGTIAVHPDYQRRGIGAALLAVGLREGIARGGKVAHLEVRKSNLPAQRLYARFGFQIVGERKRYYADNREDALLMSVYELGETYLKKLSFIH